MMRTACLVAAMAAVIATPALAEKRKAGARPAPTQTLPRDRVPDDFDLARFAGGAEKRARQASPQVPPGTDMRAIAWDPPAIEMPVGRNGAVLSVGALGRRHKGMPGLAHVGIDWDF